MANNEVDNAQRVVTEKDMELCAAQEGLCGLKEVPFFSLKENLSLFFYVPEKLFLS